MTLLPHSRNEAMKALLAKAEAKPKPVKLVLAVVEYACGTIASGPGKLPMSCPAHSRCFAVKGTEGPEVHE